MPWRRAERLTASRLNWEVDADQQDPAGGEQLAVAHRDQMDALGIAAVDLVALGHSLLDAEDVVAQLERGGQLLPAARPADLVHGGPGHRLED